MNIGKACAIFYQLNSDKYTEEEKALAIYEVMNMPTHNGIKKDVMLEAIKWLFDKAFEIEKDSDKQ